MSLDRQMLRNMAKKKHKEMMKGVPKSKRLPFDVVYKQVIMMMKNENADAKAKENAAKMFATMQFDEMQDMLIGEIDETVHTE